MTTPLVGVMVAVALVPPLAVCGMCVGAGEWGYAESASVLLLTNLVFVELAAVGTFLVQAIKPRDWWDVKRSQRVVRIVVLILLLAVAAVSVLVALHSPVGR